MKTNNEMPSKPAGPLTFPEAMYHYFKMGDALYEAKVQGTNTELIDGLQRVVDALLADIAQVADSNGFGEDFRLIIRNERGAERRTLWLRRTANRLKTTKPGLLSLELLGSAGVIVAIAYYILHLGRWLSLLCGLGILGLRLLMPWITETLAVYDERKMRKLRGRYDGLYGTKETK